MKMQSMTSHVDDHAKDPSERPGENASQAERSVEMKGKMIAYWICTVFIALCIGSGGAAQFLRVPQTVEGMTALGYPVHFIVLLGAWKVLGALTLLAPKLRVMKEWAYAGIFIDLSGAAVASAANAGGAFHVIAPVVLIGILAASWALRPESRRLPDTKTETSPAPEVSLLRSEV